MSVRELDKRVTLFCERLAALAPGERARLKRNAGKPLAGAHHEALGLFYSLLPANVGQGQEDTYFLVATLFPLAEGEGKGNLGSALRRARAASNEKGLDRRVQVLLDADETQLCFRLRQALHYLQSQRVRVDWPWLLEDLLRWGHPERFVQRAWARSYYGRENKEGE